MSETKDNWIDDLDKRVAQETLSGSYVMGEEHLLRTSRLVGSNVDQLKRETNKLVADSKLTFFKLMSELADNDRGKIEETALKAAKDFWVKKLNEPDLPANAAVLGRERIAEITQKLEELNQPPKNPQ